LWIKKLKDNADCDKLDTILVGNKCDSERIVDRDEGEETAKKVS
jgi:GTPase SAR1 family protein